MDALEYFGSPGKTGAASNGTLMFWTSTKSEVLVIGIPDTADIIMNLFLRIHLL
jgi:hypothetical protein